MKSIRQEINILNTLGPLPSENGANPELIQKYEALYRAITKPITDDEARVLVKLFGSDGCFGLASSLVHLIETAPGWPLKDCLKNLENEWIIELKNRAIRGGIFSEDT
jgi:hypothetical protein